MAKSTGKKRTKAKLRKNVVEGVAHIHATFNNTIIMITDRHGMLFRGRQLAVQVFAGVVKVRHSQPRSRLSLPAKQHKRPV